MDRYSEINIKNKREIVLLKSFPCKWGKCSFCDYIDDNSKDKSEINKLNFEVLKNITGKYKTLEIINSGSCFELPIETLEKIKEIVKEKEITKLYLESHWIYKEKIQSMRDFFNIDIVFKIGVESFDNDFRNKFLNKNAKFDTYKDVLKYFDSPCLMVGIKGQTKQMIQNDIEIALKHFKHATVNVYVNNTTEVKRDEELVKWFVDNYKYLDDIEKIDVLYNNTDFGVGD